MSILNSLKRVGGNVLLMPVSVIKDAATYLGSAVSKVPSTFETGRRIGNAVSEIVDDVKQDDDKE